MILELFHSTINIAITFSQVDVFRKSTVDFRRTSRIRTSVTVRMSREFW
jgi:hypothetical protein